MQPHELPPFPPPPSENENIAPWEMIEPGRYQPRRIRGSLLGRVLG